MRKPPFLLSSAGSAKTSGAMSAGLAPAPFSDTLISPVFKSTLASGLTRCRKRLAISFVRSQGHLREAPFSEFFQKLCIARIAADRQVDGVDVPLLQFEKCHRGQRAFPEPARRKEKNFLAVRKVPDQMAEFVGPVDEIPVIDDFAKNKRVLWLRHMVTLISLTIWRNKQRLFISGQLAVRKIGLYPIGTVLPLRAVFLPVRSVSKAYEAGNV